MTEKPSESKNESSKGPLMSLWNMSKGQKAQISHLDIKTAEHLRRIQELGFEPGETVTCLKITPFGSPRVYQVGPCVFSLSQELAEKILISSRDS